MPKLPSIAKHVWLLPIVLVVCALMVLPGGTFLASGAHAGNSAALNTGASSGLPTPSSKATANSVGPSWLSGSSHSSSLLSSLPSDLSKTPWIQSLARQGPTLQPLTSLPNLGLLEHGVTPVDGQVNPFYTAQPAPLGLADYGLGAQTYSYNTSHFLGEVTFNTPPNVTDPGSTGVIEPAGQSLGYVGSVYEFGIQLNTVATNISIPGSDQGFFWTQNVVNWNDTGIHFVDDTFNVSAGSSFYLAPGTIYSGCGLNTAGANNILYVYGGVFQCVGGTIPVSTSSYPITLELYNNATVNAQNRTVVSYGYRIIETGAGKVYTGVSDSVVFNNTAPNWQAPTAPANPPGFSVDGFQGAPAGLFRDAEIVLVGDIGGDNSVFRSVNGTINLEYSNASSGDFTSVPSAYNYGGDTGETSTGIADYWTPSHTEEINQGPAMLYGLWNAAPWVSVPSGDIQLSGSITPTYGFVFVGNVAPDVIGTNLSWLPTSSTGTFNTYLPPLGAPWTTQYYVQGFAAGSHEENGTAVTGSTTTYSLSLPAQTGVLRAPLYAFSNAQAAALADGVTGSSATPYVFNGLTIDSNFTFNHVNDYDYPSFEIFMTQGVTAPITVNNTYQGADSATGNYYIGDFPIGGPTGLLVPGGFISSSISNYTAQINIYGGLGDQVTNQVSFNVDGQGPMTLLWGDTNVLVTNATSEDRGQGVFVGDSIGTTIQDEVVETGATGITDIGSTHTTGWNITVDDALGVEALSSSAGTFSWINVTDGGHGFSAGSDNGAGVNYDQYYDLPGTNGLTVNELNVTVGGLGANITFSQHTTFTDVSTYDPVYEESGAIWLDGTLDTTITGLTANYGWGIDMYNATDTTITNYLLENSLDIGSLWDMSTGTTVTGLTVFDYALGIESGDNGGGLMDTSFTNVNISEVYFGAELYLATDTSFTNVNVSDVVNNEQTPLTGIYLEDSTGLTLNNILGYGSTAVWLDGGGSVTGNGITGTFGVFDFAVVLEDGSGATLTNLNGNEYSGAVELNDFTSATASTISASIDGVGLEVEYSQGDSASGVTASSFGVGVVVYESTGTSVTTVAAGDPSIGTEVEYSNYVTVSTVTATNGSIGLDNYESSWTSVSGVTASNMSVGVYSEDSYYTSISAVTASNSTLSSPYSGGNGYDVPAVAAVVTQYDQLDSISNVVVTTYTAAYYDDDSYDPGVNDVNATGSTYAVVLNETSYGVFTDIGAFHDWQGFVLNDDAEYNYITQSAFVDCTSYGVFIYEGYDNTVYDNTFIGNNGATGTYSAAHIQAYTGYGGSNYFYFEEVGNYWADWHTYNQYGNLAPYPLGDDQFDYYPLGGPAGTVAVWFYESGLASGTTWSVTLNGGTMSTSGSSLVFYVLPGTYSFTANAVTGYTVSPGSGSVTASGGYVELDLAYSGGHTVTVTETGLPTGTLWTVTVGGVSVNGTTTSLTVGVGLGSYGYQITPVSGYTVSPANGSITVGLSPNYNLNVAFASVSSSTSLVSTNTYNTGFAIAIAIAVIALLIGLLALFWPRRAKPSDNPAPPAAWTPPAGSSTPPPAAGTNTWSEGSGNPPS